MMWMGACGCFSRNRFNLLSFHDKDYGDGSGALLPQVDAWMAQAGIDLKGGTVRLLTMPRVFGYVFNPISIYYCHWPDGRLAAMVYEVTSTFGIRHAYVIPIPIEDQAAGVIRQGAAKALYVSPFMGMEMDYQFRGHTPGDRLDMTIDGLDAEGFDHGCYGGKARTVGGSQHRRCDGSDPADDVQGGRGDPLGGAEAVGQRRRSDTAA